MRTENIWRNAFPAAMEALCPSVTATTTHKFPIDYRKSFNPVPGANSIKIPISGQNHQCLTLSSPISRIYSSIKARTTSFSPSTSSSSLLTSTEVIERNRWIVLMDKPPEGVNSKQEITNYYVKTLEKVLGSEDDAQACIYDASFDTTKFSFCCNIDVEASSELARLPEVLSVKQHPDYNSDKKDYSVSSIESSKETNNHRGCLPLFPSGNTKHWLVRLHKPGVRVVTKAQMVDYYTQILTEVLGNEKDAQMCMYHVSWQSDFGFCCELDECAKELAGVPGVLSVEIDRNYLSDDKDYAGYKLDISNNRPESSQPSGTLPRSKKLFVTGLSFYTSEKTLRASFEGFGELVEVRIIMDKISKRSKGYAFVEYSTEEAASAALKEMNGKIINGWMITVDIARTGSYKFIRNSPSQTI